VAGAPDKILEAPHGRVARKAAAREGQVGRRSAVERAESPHALGAEVVWPSPSAGYELLELLPAGLSLLDETF
jgi:hypothetical protein